MPVKQGDTVSVEYTGKLEDGSVFDSSEHHDEPLKFTVGQGQLIPGFEQGVIGMEQGEEKEITIPSEEAYGAPREELVQEVPREQLPEGVQEGIQLSVGLPNGQRIPGTVVKLTEESATLDLNHPLAGKALIFSLKVVGIE